jgi:large subunit ribosomal protein L25
MSVVKQLKATPRARVGKGGAREARRQGFVPAVIYGGNKEPQSLVLDFNTARKLIFAGRFLSTIFELEIDGVKTRAIPREYSLDPVKDTPVHIDFLRLSEGQLVKVMIPVHVSGQDVCAGVKAGGTLQIVEHAVELQVPVDNIPDAIDISVADLAIGHAIHIQDITLPEGAKITSRENLTLVTVVGAASDEA